MADLLLAKGRKEVEHHGRVPPRSSTANSDAAFSYGEERSEARSAVFYNHVFASVKLVAENKSVPNGMLAFDE